MSEEFYRMKRLPPYVIAEVNAMRAAARAAGEDIIDLGMGNPDLPPPPHVIDKLCEVAQKPDAHGYSQSKGIPGLRRAQANYYGRRFGVEVDPETEVVVTMGSKEGLASLATAITAPGDVVLAPNPSYPIHTFGFIIAGATIRSVPTTPDEHYFRAGTGDELHRAAPVDAGRELSVEPDRGDGRSGVLRTAGRLGEGEQGLGPLRPCLFRALFRRQADALDLAGAGREGCRGRIYLDVQDLFDGRLADRLCGGQQAIDRRADAGEKLSRLWRLHPDSGRGLRRAQRPAGHRREQPRTVSQAPRRDGRGLRPRRLGHPPAARHHVRLGPAAARAQAHLGSLEFSKQLLTQAKVAVAPGVGYGEDGEGYVRIAMVENEQRLRQAARNIKRYLQSMGVNTPTQSKAI